MRPWLALFLIILAGPSAAAEHAVALVYHHVATDTPPSTSVTPAEFRRHMDYLETNGFHVLGLEAIVRKLQSGETIPDKTVAITFDDAYESVLINAMPELRKRKWPFTVFVSTDSVDHGLNPYLSWEQLKAIMRHGGEIGNHSASHGHMIRGERHTDAWETARRADVRKAQRRIEEKLGVSPRLFAFPYGEYTAELVRMLQDMNLTPIGQHSGAISSQSVVIPRFPVSSQYASIETLADKLRSVPFDLLSVSPTDGLLDDGGSPPKLVLTFNVLAKNPAALTCFVAGQGTATIRWSGRVATVQAQQALRPGRTKYNCTRPSSAYPGRFEWFSFLWMKPVSKSEWYTE